MGFKAFALSPIKTSMKSKTFIFQILEEHVLTTCIVIRIPPPPLPKSYDLLKDGEQTCQK